MGFIPIKKLDLFLRFSIALLRLATMLDTPTCIWIVPPFALCLALLLLLWIGVCNAVHAIHNLDRHKLDPLLKRYVNDFRQRLLKCYQFAAPQSNTHARYC